MHNLSESIKRKQRVCAAVHHHRTPQQDIVLHLSICTSSPGRFTSNDLITIRCGTPIKSRRGMGMFVQRYCATTSTLYLEGLMRYCVSLLMNLQNPHQPVPTNHSVPENSADRYDWSIIRHSPSDKLLDLFMLHHGSIGFYKVHLQNLV